MSDCEMLFYSGHVMEKSMPKLQQLMTQSIKWHTFILIILIYFWYFCVLLKEETHKYFVS